MYYVRAAHWLTRVQRVLRLQLPALVVAPVVAPRVVAPAVVAVVAVVTIVAVVAIVAPRVVALVVIMVICMDRTKAISNKSMSSQRQWHSTCMLSQHKLPRIKLEKQASIRHSKAFPAGSVWDRGCLCIQGPHERCLGSDQIYGHTSGHTNHDMATLICQ
jgi:hypothetical protein